MPWGLMTVRIKAKREDGRGQVSLRVSEADALDAAPAKGGLRISP